MDRVIKSHLGGGKRILLLDLYESEGPFKPECYIIIEQVEVYASLFD